MLKETQPIQTNQKLILTPKQTIKKNSKDITDNIKLYICTIFPGKEDTITNKTIISEEMDFNKRKLSKIDGLEPHFIWIKSGEFSHRHLKHVPDVEQCRIRNIYLDKVPNDEWLLVLDADELLFGALTNIPTILRILNENPHIDYCMLSELLPNGELKLRPRLIRKRKGLNYGGENNKHDYIEYTYLNKEDGMRTINYIDVSAVKRSWLLDFLGFFHYKNGWAMELYSNEGDVKFEIPSNMVQLERLEEYKEIVRD